MWFKYLLVQKYSFCSEFSKFKGSMAVVNSLTTQSGVFALSQLGSFGSVGFGHSTQDFGVVPSPQVTKIQQKINNMH